MLLDSSLELLRGNQLRIGFRVLLSFSLPDAEWILPGSGFYRGQAGGISDLSERRGADRAQGLILSKDAPGDREE